LDPDLVADCQQLTGKTYSGATESFDRGHLVPANHLDHLKLGIYQSNYVTNILPQARNMNRGAWLLTEEIIECFREKGVLHVYGGPIYDSTRDRDFFNTSHGVRTPSAFWKVIISNEDQIAWIIPNIAEAKRSKLDGYLVSLEKIEAATGTRFQSVDEEDKSAQETTSWKKPDGCDLS
jgi:endonuclease G